MTSDGLLHPQVDVDSNASEEMWKKIEAGQYRPTPNDQVLDAMEFISDVWERPTDIHLHVFVGLPGRVGSLTLVNTGGECFIRFFAPSQDI
jgi:hypothetical protein